MSYLWHLDGLSMALGIGELDGCTRSWNTKCHSIFFLNTNNSNNTNVFWHTDLTHGFFALDVWTRDFFWTRILRITRILFGTRISRISRILSLRLVVNDSSLWLLTRCGYWLIVVIGLLWFLTCYVLNDKSKKISVSHAKHWQIREIREIRVLKKWEPCAK